jgi:hypothetical protein
MLEYRVKLIRFPIVTKEMQRGVSVTGAAIAKCLNYFFPSNTQIYFEQKKLVKKPE